MIPKNTYHYCPVDFIISLCKFLHYFSMLGIFLSKPFKEKVYEKIGKAEFLSKQCQHKTISRTVTTIFSWFQFMTSWTVYSFALHMQSPQNSTAPLSFQNKLHLYKNMIKISTIYKCFCIIHCKGSCLPKL